MSLVFRKHFKRLFCNIEKNGLKGYVYDFSADYNAIAVADILAIHEYLMKKNGTV